MAKNDNAHSVRLVDSLERHIGYDTAREFEPESVNASKNIMGTGVSLSKYPNSHLQRDEMHS